MISIFNFIIKKDKKYDSLIQAEMKGVGFNSLGKISILASREQMKPFLPKIFDLIDEEISKKPQNIQKDMYIKSLQNTDVLLCIKDLAKNYGREIEERYGGAHSKELQVMRRLPGGGHRQMYEFICNLFYFGFKKQLIDCLKELTKICNGQYKMGIQTKLLNTINIILTHNRNSFPVMQLINNFKKNLMHRRKEQKKKSAINSNLAEDDSQLQFGKGDISMSESTLIFEEAKSGANTSRSGQNLDPTNLYDPKYIESQKIGNLQTLLDNESQVFLLNLCQGVRDSKIAKKLPKGELDKIKEE